MAQSSADDCYTTLFCFSDDDISHENLSVRTEETSFSQCSSIELSFGGQSLRLDVESVVFDRKGNIHLDPDESIKLEDLSQIDTCSIPSANISLEIALAELDESGVHGSPSSSPPIPEFDQLQNLPYEIVERPRHDTFYSTDHSIWVLAHLQSMLDDAICALENNMPLVLHLRNRHRARWTETPFTTGSRGHRFRTYFSCYINQGCLTRVIEIIIEALNNNVIITKRYDSCQRLIRVIFIIAIPRFFGSRMLWIES